jgi:hypothetical protein
MRKLLIQVILSVLVLVGVLFPHPVLLCRQIANYTHGVTSLVEPQNPALDVMVREAHRYKLKEEPAKVINYVVSQHVKYEGNFQTWGVAEYWPTVTELIKEGKGNCIGTAIVTASLATRLGYTNYEFASTRDHMWIRFHSQPATSVRPPIAPAVTATPTQAVGQEVAPKPEKTTPTERPQCPAFRSAIETLQYIGVVRCTLIAGLLLIIWLHKSISKLWT